MAATRPEDLHLLYIEAKQILRFAQDDEVALRLLRHLLLAGNRTAWSLLRAGVRVRALAAYRQPATMTNAAIRTNVHQSLDVHRDFGAQRALDLVVALDDTANLVDVSVCEIANTQRRVDTGFLENLHR